MTKNLARQALDKCMLQLNQHRTAGRAKASLDLQGRGKTDAATDSSPGAEFVVAICGEIMTMPGLPRTPAAETIRINDKGEIEGLF